MYGTDTLRRAYRKATIKRLEAVALGSTTVAFALTVMLAGSAYAVESNPFAAELLETLGWVGAGVLALVLEALIFEGYQRLERGAPRGARAGAALVAGIGLADVLANLYVLARVGTPPALSGRLVGAIALVSCVAVALAKRELVLEALRLPSRTTIRVVGVSLLVIAVALASVGPFVGSLNSIQRAAADHDWNYTGTSHDVLGEDSNTQDIFEDSNRNWWMVGTDNDSVHKYDSNWNYTGTTHDLSAEMGYPSSIFKGDDGNWYVLDATTRAVYVYDSSWSYTGTKHNVSDQDDGYPRGIYQDSEGNWWMVGDGTDSVYKYDSSWSYTGTNYNISSESTRARDIHYDGKNWWMTGIENNNVYKYDSSWSYTGTTYDVSTEDGFPHGIYQADTGNWWMAGSEFDNVYEYGGHSFSSGDTSSATYKQIYKLDDRSGLFPPDRSLITLYEWDPGAKSIDAPSESEEWSHVTSKGFNADAKATFDMVDGDYYKLSIQGPTGDTWELIGFEANSSTTEQTLTIADFGTEGTPTSTAEPTPTPTAYPNGSTPVPEATPTPTPEQGFGPDMVGYCSVPDSEERGVELEYWDPKYETTDLQYHLTDNGTVYSGSKTFSDPVGYWRGCVAGEALGNDTEPPELDGTANVTRDGETVNTSLEWPDPTTGAIGGGPVGSGGDSTATEWGGWLLLAGGAYLGYRRFGDGELAAALGQAGQQVRRLLENR
jgi:hypothetical protein